MQRNRLSVSLLTAAFILVLGWFGIDKFLSPLVWIGWVPLWMEGLFGFARETWLTVIGTFEVLLALLLLIPRRSIRQLGASLIILHLAAVLTQTGFSDIGIRDAGLLLASIALRLLL